MQKIKIAFAALTAIAGIGGAYATTHQTTERVGTIYKWVTATFQVQTVIAAATVGTAVAVSGCPTLVKPIKCLVGKAPNKPNRTLYRP